jgi:hypothetical protein
MLVSMRLGPQSAMNTVRTKRMIGPLSPPPSAFTEDVVFTHPGDDAELRCTYERSGSMYARGLQFHRVRAYRFRAEGHCTPWHVEDAGAHGLPNGSMVADASMYADDVARFGDLPGVTIHDVASISPEAISGVLQRPGTIMGGFCNSTACLGAFR